MSPKRKRHRPPGRQSTGPRSKDGEARPQATSAQPKATSARPQGTTAPGAAQPENGPRRSPGKRLLFHALTVLLFFGLLELVLAAARVRPVVVEEDPYVGFTSYLPLYVPNADGERLRTARNKLSLFNEQTFPRRKPRGVRRIFTVGGSTTYGRPFADPTSFSGWLRTYLEAVAPGQWEVINAGGISYASYRVATLIEELVDYEPDLFIIYSGHNEFLERRTYSGLIEEPPALTRTKLLLQHSRLWALGRRVVEHRQRQAQSRFELTGEVEEVLESSAGLDYYFRDEGFARQVLDHYRYNLARMIRLARAAGSEVVLVTVPVNESDFSPFKSQHRDGLPEADRRRHAELLDEAAERLDRGEPEAALAAAREASELDPLHAHGHFLLGRALTDLGRHEEASGPFARAIAEDVCPLRAGEEINRTLVEIADSDEVDLIDYRALLRAFMRKHHGHPNLGDELFLDHAHPTVEAHGILARALVEHLGADRRVSLERLSVEVEDVVRSEVLGRIDRRAQAEAYKNLSKVLLWAGKIREAERYVELAGAVLGEDWEVHYNAGRAHLDAGRSGSAVASFKRAVELNPQAAAAHDLLSAALAAGGDLEAAIEAGRTAASLAPEMASAWNNLAGLYGANGQLDEALAASRRAVELQPGFAEGHNNLGKAHFDLGMLEEALAAFDRALELRPRYLEAMVNRGLLLGELGRLEAARDAFTAALDLDPDLAAAHFGRGKALLGLGDANQASAALERAATLDPSRLETWELWAQATAASAPARAAEVLARGLELHPRSARLHHQRGRLLAGRGELERAAEALARATELDPGRLAARIDLGNLHMARRQEDRAIAAFRAALEIAPTDPRVHHVLATALLVSGDLVAGRRHLEGALELDPSNAMASHDLAQVYEHEGRLAEALALYRQAASRDPDLAAARAGAERLATRLGEDG